MSLNNLGPKGRVPPCRSRAWFRMATFTPGVRKDLVKRTSPFLVPMIGHARRRLHGENVEVSARRRDFVPDDRREVLPHAQPLGVRFVVDVDVVIGRDRQLDPFAGQRDHPLGDRGVAVARIRQRVNVRVAGDVARRGNFAADGQRMFCGLAHRQRGLDLRQRVFEPASRIDRVLARPEPRIGLCRRPYR